MRLILMRHAKSDWDGMCSDHERPLSQRGKRAAPKIGTYLSERGYIPEQAIISDSTRTRETNALVAEAWPEVVPVRLEAKLYHASAAMMFEVLKSATAQTVLVVGHNPGIAAFAEAMVSQPPEHGRFFDYPTCATTVIDFDISDWSEVETGTGQVLDFVIPREL